MSIQEKEFFIMAVVQGELCGAIGRCGDVPIQLGDVFDSIYKYQARMVSTTTPGRPFECMERPGWLCTSRLSKRMGGNSII